jgi:hypothetical protein
MPALQPTCRAGRYFAQLANGVFDPSEARKAKMNGNEEKKERERRGKKERGEEGEA